MPAVIPLAAGAAVAAGTAGTLGAAGAIAAGAAAAGAASSAMSSREQAKAAEKAAKLQAQGYSDATAAQLAMFEAALEDQQQARYESIALSEPWRKAGENALAKLQGMIARGPGSYDHRHSPSYQFEMQEGQNAIDKSMAARGLSGSGAALKALQGYSQGLANKDYWQGYNNHMNQYYQRLTPFQSMAGLGMTMTGNQQNAIQGYANAAGNLYRNTGNALGQNAIGAGNAGASGYINQANAFTGGMNSMTGNLFNGLLMNQLFKTPSGGGTQTYNTYNVPAVSLPKPSMSNYDWSDYE